MDLILLQPGDPALLAGIALAAPDSLIDGPVREGLPEPGTCIELVSLHQGLGRPRDADGRVSGRPVITELTCVKYVDASSVKLYDCCLRAQPLGSGKDQPTVIHIGRTSGNRTVSIIKIALRDAVVTEIRFESHPNDLPTEHFKLGFSEILWTYSAQAGDGANGAPVQAGWDLARNRPAGAGRG